MDLLKLRFTNEDEIVSMMRAIAESCNGSSWPAGYKDRILDWVIDGDYRSPPLELQGETATPESYAKLSKCHGRTGEYDDGLKSWPYRRDIISGSKVFHTIHWR